MAFTDLEKAVYQSVDRCIYCGATDDLRREHIVPHALYPGSARGEAVLLNASCPEHETATKKFEEHALHEMLGKVRMHTGLKSRSGHARTRRSVAVTSAGKDGEQRVDVPMADAPVLVHFPIFAPPGFLSPGSYAGGLTITGVATYSFGLDPRDVARDRRANRISVTQSYRPTPFAKMVAKIAYCVAWAEGVLAQVEDDEVAVLPAIRGDRDDIGRWVGTFQGEFTKADRMLHRVAFHENHDLKLLIGEVQLFAQSGTPSYEVILGGLR